MNILLKALAFLLIFSVFHFGYEITGWRFLTPFCGINESVFQHLKMAYWSYLFLSVVEYLLVNKGKKRRVSNFLYSRALSTILIPWVIFIIWYMLPAILGSKAPFAVELSWAIISTLLSFMAVAKIEKETESIAFGTMTRIVLITLIIISSFLFVKFTYKLPWIDLFQNPETIKDF